ncbi:MAG: bifunctional tRNA (5-methylaminomethyl-2-thiouridine)(34)-methyltransferase MnmD/FAD-dependent 5-carboxymethylaminomethyl-2-thiouridine(34) oxidoreductase MnmC [Gallionellaceae bacterium]|jgi:tRNA 5-methylaminomethyl-2-thiouridine biosynthesis bifunctional protein|nr:bifunctional tRNA (5-methylaminomethyl-2-thiouridine)(34)-methyltransferase MnmD/FAD-dependent 5-carboxymethylaminomethyl-2-thiouridine(34) oxidoreductase MnmC [Gallionellaceae bacterium]
MPLTWQNGLPYSRRFDDVYFSADSGLQETRHVFLHGNRLAERFAALQSGESFTIGETGFGTGLNFLCAWREFENHAPPDASLDFFSVEKFPLTLEDLRAALALWPELHTHAEPLLTRWQRRVPGWNRWTFAAGKVRLTLACCDVMEALTSLPEAAIAAWFLDGFSPAKNPDMWAQPVLDTLARASRSNATLATYTSAGWVRRGLQQAGFIVERAAGFERKRDMLRGMLSPSPQPLSHEGRGALCRPPKTAIIIGGGVSGCAVAHALTQRGTRVTLLERAPHLADAASGNPLGILHARFGASDHPLHRLVLAAYGHALALFDEVLPVDDEVRGECGLLQLACSPDEERRISRLTAREWPPHLLRAVNAAEASALAGVAMSYGGLWFPAGGWVVPPALCERLASGAERHYRREVTALTRTDAGWRVSGNGWNMEAEIAVVCCAQSALQLAQFADFPLTAVRGQISLIPATQASRALRAVVCGAGYCSPALHGAHITGATHGFDDEGLDVRAADHADNLAKLTACAPALRTALGDLEMTTLSGRAAVRCSAPGAAPLAGEVQRGLYCSLAHGTRGLLTAGLAGEVIAAQAAGQLAMLPREIGKLIAPRMGGG